MADAAAPWLIQNIDLLPDGGDALDVACGAGHNALYLAEAGFRVRAVDRNAHRLAALEAAARERKLAIRTESLDLEAGTAELGAAAYDLIVVFHYLHRPLLPALVRALRPEGVLVYETYTVDQRALGRPTNPEFLLGHGELRRLLASLVVLRERDGLADGRYVAGVVARRSL